VIEVITADQRGISAGSFDHNKSLRSLIVKKANYLIYSQFKLSIQLLSLSLRSFINVFRIVKRSVNRHKLLEDRISSKFVPSRLES